MVASEMVGAGTRMALVGIVAVSFVSMIGSRAPCMVTSPDLFICPMLVDLGRHLPYGDGATYAAMAILAVGTTGIALIFAGQSALLRIGEFVPYPIICGLLGAVGICILKQSFAIAIVIMVAADNGQCPLTCEYQRTIVLFLPALCFGICGIVLGARYQGNPARSTLPLLALSLCIFYFCLLLLTQMGAFGLVDDNFYSQWQQALKSARACGFLFDPAILTDHSSHDSHTIRWLFTWTRLHQVHWSALLSSGFIVRVAALCLLVVLKSSLMYPAWERAFRDEYLRGGGKQMDMRRELSSIGIAQLVAALIGAFGAQPQLTTAVSLREMGARPHSLLPGATIIALCLLTNGAQALSLIPKFAFAGLLISQGWVLVLTFFLQPCFRPPRALSAAESGVVISILIAFVTKGMLVGMSIGAQLAVLLFVIKSHGFGVFKYHGSVALIRSTTQRSPFACRQLDEDGHQVQVLRLHSLLYYGNAAQLVRSIKQLLLPENDSSVRYIVLDLTLVLDLDASAADAFLVAAELCHARGATLIISGCGPKHDVRSRIERVGLQLLQVSSVHALNTDHIIRAPANLVSEDEDDTTNYISDIQFLDSSWKPAKKSPRVAWIADTFDDALSACEDALLYANESVSRPQSPISSRSRVLSLTDDDETTKILSFPQRSASDEGTSSPSKKIKSKGGFERVLRMLEHRCGPNFVDVPTLLEIEPLTRIVRFEPNDLVFGQAFQSPFLGEEDDLDGVLFIEHGICSIRREPDQAPQTCQGLGTLQGQSPVFRLLRLGPGGVVGIPELFTGRRSLGATRAETRCLVHLIPFSAIRQLMQDKPHLALALYKMLGHLLGYAFDERSEEFARTIDLLQSEPRREIIPAVKRYRANRTGAFAPHLEGAKKTRSLVSSDTLKPFTSRTIPVNSSSLAVQQQRRLPGSTLVQYNDIGDDNNRRPRGGSASLTAIFQEYPPPPC